MWDDKHVDIVKELIERPEYPAPRLVWVDEELPISTNSAWTMFILEGYQYGEKIKAYRWLSEEIADMKLIFIRHGDPDYEKDSLTEKGWRKLEILAGRVSRWNIRDIYCSPFGRTGHNFIKPGKAHVSL